MGPNEDRVDHWQRKYAATATDRLGWYRPRLDASLRLIRSLRLDKDARIIDVGGGASTLVDDLLADGHSRVTVLDIAAAALERTRDRLGDAAAEVQWLTGDIAQLELPASAYDLWHDRAVFHFLTDRDDRRRYLARLRRSLAPGGHVVSGRFSLQAPPECSGLPVVRYDAGGLSAEFGADFRLLTNESEPHATPGGTEQPYAYCLLRYDPR